MKVRWLGGGVCELSSHDDSRIVLVDAWIWSNTGFERFAVQKPPELSNRDAFVEHLVARRPQVVLVALTHDHVDHAGDYFELLSSLARAGIDVKTVGQSDLIRAGFGQRFAQAGIDAATLVLNAGAGINFGGVVEYLDIRIRLVPAIHSTLAGYPAAGFVIEFDGERVYCSGDTDLYGDMELVGRRYQPTLGLICVGDGGFTMGPEDAAEAVRLLHLPHVIPIHYGHNPRVRGPEAATEFASGVAALSPHTRVSTLRPGDIVQLA